MSLEVKGLEGVISRISSLPDESKEQILTDVADYGLEVIREYPPQKYVTRASAYGVPFFSDKQRRYFFAALRDGRISVPYHRSDRLKDAWGANVSPSQVSFTNSTPYAPYVMGFAAQSRHEQKVGWKKINDIMDGKLSFRSSKFRAVVHEAVFKAIKKLKLG